MKLLVNDLKLYFGLMFLLPLTLAGHKLPLTLAGHKLHLTLPTGSFFHLLVFLTLIGGALQQRREFLRPGQILRRVPAAGLPAGSPHLPSPHLISRIIAMEVLHHD